MDLKVFILVVFVWNLQSIHINHLDTTHLAAQSELDTLRAQQATFEKGIHGLIQNLTDIEEKVNKTTDTNKKAIILENAILSEREQIFRLSNQIIPPFNLSQDACRELTNEQKIKLLDQIEAAKAQVTRLKEIAAKIPACDEIVQVNADVNRQLIILQNVEKVIYTKCDSEIVLSPTIFQSNLYAPNWVLGNQTIDDVIEEYYQRSIQYHNITNCPEAHPFFTGSACINCTSPKPIFNLFSKQCDVCPFDTTLNSDLRICEQIKHRSNFTDVQNYGLDGATGMPQQDLSQSPCPHATPFFNGSCVPCKLPSYWSIKDNKCKRCLTGKVFDINDKECSTPTGPLLTQLQNTKWVTNEGNITKVLATRAAILSNATTPYNYCTEDAPYYDGIKCISCPTQFNLDTLKCTTPPDGLVYDPNLARYVPQEFNKQTEPKAHNLLSPSPLSDSAVPNCNATNPYYDGIACIYCQSPFLLFDTTRKTCVACDATEEYNNKTLKCEPRPKVYISTNMNNLLATPKMSTDEYKKELYKKVNTTDAIVYPCEDPTYYSNFTHCFSCPEYFNVEKKKCDTCNGTLNTTTKLCTPKRTLLTNLSSPNLLLTGNNTLQKYIDEQGAIDPPTKICNRSQPYSPDGVVCLNCSAPNSYYDLERKICVSCPDMAGYNDATRHCEKGQLVTNTKALKNYIEVDNYTLANIEAQNKKLNETKKIIPCDSLKPLYNGTGCISCPANHSYNLKTSSCVGPKNVTNVKALAKAKNYFEVDNYTLANLKAAINSSKVPTVPCPSAIPIYRKGECKACPNGTIVLLSNLSCVTPKPVSNITALKLLDNVVEGSNDTLSDLEDSILQAPYPTTPCPAGTPFYNGSECISCNSSAFYNLEKKSCMTAIPVTNVDYLAQNKNYIEVDNYTLANEIKKQNASTMPLSPCPSSRPLYNKTSCIKCPSDSFYNLKELNCQPAQLYSNVTALNQKKDYVEVDNYTLRNIAAANDALLPPKKPCNSSKPVFDGKTCVSCPKGLFINLKNYTCVVPRFVTNVTALAESDEYLEIDNYTLSNIEASNNLLPPPTTPCPQPQPMFNGSHCMNCPEGSYYNLKSLECQVPLLVTNVTALRDQKKAIEVDNYTLANIQQQNAKMLLPTTECPQSKPFLNGTVCATCPAQNYINLKTKTCVNSNHYTNITELENNQYIETGNSTLANLKQKVANTPSPKTECPAKTPYWSGTTCLACSLPTSYDLKTNTCKECPSNQIYNSANHQCSPKSVHYPNLANYSWVVDKPTDAKKVVDFTKAQKAIPGSLECPADRPFYSNITKDCVACSSSSYFNYDTSTCIDCTLPNQVDFNTHYCRPKQEGVYHTNIGSPNLTYGGVTKNEHIDDYNAQKAKYPNIQDCKSPKPYFDGFDCISCPQNHPYFNLANKACEKCPTGSIYNENIHECSSNGEPIYSPPNIEKMYSSIF